MAAGGLAWPLAAYDRVERRKHDGTKTFTTTACSFPLSIHHHHLDPSSTASPSCRRADAPGACAGLLHLVHAFGRRFPGPRGADDPDFEPFRDAFFAAGGSSE